MMNRPLILFALVSVLAIASAQLVPIGVGANGDSFRHNARLQQQQQQHHHNHNRNSNNGQDINSNSIVDYERDNLVPMTANDNAGPMYHIEMPAMNEKTDKTKDEPSPPSNEEASRSSDSASNTDDTERPAINSETNSGSSSSANGNSNDEDDEPSGGTFHVRRIIIAPSMGPSAWWFNSPFAMAPSAPSIHSFSGERARGPSSMFDNEPFLSPLLRILGGRPLVTDDDSSDMSGSDSNDERLASPGEQKQDNDNTKEASENKPVGHQSSSTDDKNSTPVWLPSLFSPERRANQLMTMLQQAFQSHLNVFPELQKHLDDMVPSSSDNNNNGTTAAANNNGNASTNASDSSSLKPGTHNEVKEDIVEYDGVKYLRKTIITKNVGPSHLFYTKRYIMTPLNETAPSSTTTTTTESSASDNTNSAVTTSTTIVTPAPYADVTTMRSVSPSSLSDTSVTTPAPTTTTTSTAAPESSSLSTTVNAREQLEKEETVTEAPSVSVPSKKETINSTSTVSAS